MQQQAQVEQAPIKKPVPVIQANIEPSSWMEQEEVKQMADEAVEPSIFNTIARGGAGFLYDQAQNVGAASINMLAEAAKAFKYVAKGLGAAAYFTGGMVTKIVVAGMEFAVFLFNNKDAITDALKDFLLSAGSMMGKVVKMSANIAVIGLDAATKAAGMLMEGVARGLSVAGNLAVPVGIAAGKAIGTGTYRGLTFLAFGTGLTLQTLYRYSPVLVEGA